MSSIFLPCRLGETAKTEQAAVLQHRISNQRLLDGCPQATQRHKSNAGSLSYQCLWHTPPRHCVQIKTAVWQITNTTGRAWQETSFLCNRHLTLLKFSNAAMPFFKQHSSFLRSNTQVTCFLLLLGEIQVLTFSFTMILYSLSCSG